MVGNPAGRAQAVAELIRFMETKVTLAERRRRRKAGTLSELSLQDPQGRRQR